MVDLTSFARELQTYYPIPLSALIQMIKGSLCTLREYALAHFRDRQDLLRLAVHDIDQIIGVPGFGQYLPRQLLESLYENESKQLVHDINPQLARRRALTRARVQRYRTRHRNRVTVTHVTQSRAQVIDPKPPRNALQVTHVTHVTQDVTPVTRIFEHWQTEHRRSKTRLDAKRRKLITAALGLFDEDTLKRAISGYKLSAYHMGENETRTLYNDIELFLRDAKHIEAGLQFGERGTQRGPLTVVERAMQNLRQGINGNGVDHEQLVTIEHGCSETSGEAGLGAIDRLFR